MSSQNVTSQDTQNLPGSSVPWEERLLIFLVALAGLLFALNLLPMLMPGLTYSVGGSEPKVYWFLSRGSAIAAYWLLWLSLSMGIVITNKLAQLWPGIPPAYEIHEYASLLGLGFALFHAMILMGDHYINYSLAQVLIPFNSPNYRPGWVGLGQIAFYLWAVIAFSFYVRKFIGKKTWRVLHFFSYASFLGVMLHGIFSGTDSGSSWATALYLVSGALVLILTIYRILIIYIPVEKERSKRAVQSTN